MQILELKKEFDNDWQTISDSQDLEKLRIKYLGKKGKIAQAFTELKKLSLSEKKQIGPELNELKKEIEKNIDKFSKNISQKEELSNLYQSLPGKKPEMGHLHVTTQAIREIIEVFKPLGFNRVRYPEVDWDFFAFESLNMPREHAARDEWETFFIQGLEDKKMGKAVITPHTSSGQVREMLKGKLPIRMLNIGRCGRRQIDINHIPSFYQFEGLVIDKGINITHLKGLLDYFAKNFYGPERKTRIRPFHFRFTEPSFEVDINCDLCLGKGCRFCKSGWVELGGAGMVHPNVLKFGKIDPEKYTGFAFGWGIERTYMMKSGTKINDIRHLFSNDFRFLEQF
ncbi:MAG: phenylalanine--tRNA ligase subunit alpha [Candidatus Pacebacteria bacterium]|nr:phenylalanine--tRNA ligase subunit alpha [Candidatus Paceibacterota bacterium]